MQRWEYLTRFINASKDRKWAKEGLEFYQREDMACGGDNLKLGKYAPQYMMGVLNRLGGQGWELVHMEPVFAGRNDDIAFFGEPRGWSNWYFCVFKRPRQD